ncbi:MAG: CDP-diacylglycerol--serine O-phosphatidyltransferase [Calditrichaceae bacterium]|nr:CDP-diacylglycerol--serine O-phosphatidyltransferase [Calditrichia bacterium]NUQ43835.1 CDP-diacylglycerol--serine O-phosphatidyltransferase [Calditrichaceae bacterium]
MKAKREKGKLLRVRAGIVPGLFTMANMFCGYYSVILSCQGKFITAAWLIVAAAVLDVLDGKLARLTQSSSDFGVQYDSLADVISFGIAPSMLSYYVFFQNWGTIGLLLSFVPLVFGSIRLARFNIRLVGHDKKHFEGLPSPAAAITIATFVIFSFDAWGLLQWSKVFLGVILLVSLLMITLIRYETMPNFSLHSSRANRLKILSVVIALLVLLFFPQEAFFPLAMVYVLSGPLRVIWLLVASNNDRESTEEKENKE